MYLAADRVLIPYVASYLPVKGLQMLMKTIAVVYKKLLCELDKIEIRDMPKIQERRLTIIRGYKQSQIEK